MESGAGWGKYVVTHAVVQADRMAMSNPDTRSRILATAQALFFAKGFGHVGTNTICQEAKVNKGTLYHFFSSKTDLAIAALEDYGSLSRQEIERIVRGPAQPLAKLKRVLSLPLKAARANKAQGRPLWGCLVGNLAVEMAAENEAIATCTQAIFEAWRVALEPLIEELSSTRDLGPLKPRFGAEALLAYMEGVTVMAKAHNQPAWIARLIPGGLGLLQQLSREQVQRGGRP